MFNEYGGVGRIYLWCYEVAMTEPVVDVHVYEIEYHIRIEQSSCGRVFERFKPREHRTDYFIFLLLMLMEIRVDNMSYIATLLNIQKR